MTNRTCHLYANKDRTEIYRILGAGNDNELYCAECIAKKLFFIPKSKLIDFEEINENEMRNILGVKIPEYKTLSDEQKRLCRYRYNIISPMLFHMGKSLEMISVREHQCEKYKVSQQTFNRYMRFYAVFGCIEALLIHFDINPHLNKKEGAKSSVLKTTDYRNDYKEYGCCYLLCESVSNEGFAYLMVDSLSEAIIASTFSKERTPDAISNLFYECKKNRKLPTKIIGSGEEWIRFYKKELIKQGVDVFLNTLGYINYHQINSMVENLSSLSTDLESNLRISVCIYNKEFNSFNEPRIVSHEDLHPIFKDSYFVPHSF